MMSSLSTDREIIGIALGRIPSGCAILTATHDGKSTGLLVSWVQQASFEPLMLTVCIKEERPATKLIAGSGRFLLNVIGEDPTAMFKHFGKGFSPDEDAFAGLTVRSTGFGPAISSVTGKRFEPLSYARLFVFVPTGRIELPTSTL